MNMDLKIPWISKVTEEKRDEAIEFSNIRQVWNSHDGGYKPWTLLKTIGSLTTGLVTKTATYSASLNDHIVLMNTTSAALTLTLPSAIGIVGRQYIVVNVGTKILTIATVSAQTINGGTSISLPAQYFSVMLLSDGANWLAI